MRRRRGLGGGSWYYDNIDAQGMRRRRRRRGGGGGAEEALGTMTTQMPKTRQDKTKGKDKTPIRQQTKTKKKT